MKNIIYLIRFPVLVGIAFLWNIPIVVGLAGYDITNILVIWCFLLVVWWIAILMSKAFRKIVASQDVNPEDLKSASTVPLLISVVLFLAFVISVTFGWKF